VDFIEEPCTFEIRREVAYAAWPNGTRMAFPLDVFRVQVARANGTLAEYDARKAQVVPMRARKKSGGDQAA